MIGGRADDVDIVDVDVGDVDVGDVDDEPARPVPNPTCTQPYLSFNV